MKFIPEGTTSGVDTGSTMIGLENFPGDSLRLLQTGARWIGRNGEKERHTSKKVAAKDVLAYDMHEYQATELRLEI